MTVGLEHACQPPTDSTQPSEYVDLYSPDSHLASSGRLKALGGSLALTGQRRRKAALPRQSKLPYATQWAPNLVVCFAPGRGAREILAAKGARDQAIADSVDLKRRSQIGMNLNGGYPIKAET
jgi:hypothetical protein